MADELKDDPNYPRRRADHYEVITTDYYPNAEGLIAAIRDGLEKVPEECRAHAWISPCNEDSNEWSVGWSTYESDEDYRVRLAEIDASFAKQREDTLDVLRKAKAALDSATTTKERRMACHHFENALRRAEGIGLDVSEFE